jgi:hypothetical protein
MGMLPMKLQAAAHSAVEWATQLSYLQTWDTNQKGKRDSKDLSSTIIQSMGQCCAWITPESPVMNTCHVLQFFGLFKQSLDMFFVHAPWLISMQIMKLNSILSNVSLQSTPHFHYYIKHFKIMKYLRSIKKFFWHELPLFFFPL